MKTTLTISEIFGPTIHGEGSLVGRPTIFVRSGGCDFRCSWCDTLYAVLPEFRSTWTELSTAEVMAKITALSGNTPMLVTLSGGNPALQPFADLIQLGRARGYSFALETQGSVAQLWFQSLDHLVLSPKPPSSGMTYSAALLSNCLLAAGLATQTTLKVVVFDENDYRFALTVHQAFPNVRFVLQPGNCTTGRKYLSEATAEAPEIVLRPVDFDSDAIAEKTEWLMLRAINDGWQDVAILPQVHTLLWGNRPGV